MLRIVLTALITLNLASLYCQTEIELLPQAVILPRDNSILGAKGAIRFNQIKNYFEGHNGSQWSEFLQPQHQCKTIISAPDLQAENSADTYHRNVASAWFNSTSTSPVFLKSIELRAGWQLDSLIIYYRDNSPSTALEVAIAIYDPQVGASTELIDLTDAFESAGSSNLIRADTYQPLIPTGYTNPSFFVHVTTSAAWPNGDIEIKRLEVFTSKE